MSNRERQERYRQKIKSGELVRFAAVLEREVAEMFDSLVKGRDRKKALTDIIIAACGGEITEKGMQVTIDFGVDKFVEVDGLQYIKVDEWPTALKSVAEISEATGMPEDKIIQYCEDRMMPHYRFDGGEPRFRIKEVKDWMVDSARIYYSPAKTIKHEVITYTMPPSKLINSVPKELVNLSGLRDLSTSTAPSGVYFLVDGEELVYIGQSVNPIARVGQHKQDKCFTHAFLLPVPKDQLNNIEGALIRALAPKYNNVTNGAPRGDIDDSEVLESLALEDI